MKKHVKQSLTAGVFLSDRHISLVLTGQRKLGAARELVKWAHVEIPDLMDTTSPRFAAFFRSTLSEFMGRHRNAAVWTAIDSRELKLRNLNIPDIADAKMANAALWGLKKDVDVDGENDIFDFEFIEDTHINGIKKKNVVAFSGDKKQINFLKHLFADAGFPLTGITTLPFALQNYVRTHAVEVGPIPLIIVHVARYHSEITCLSEKGVLLTRSIKTGTSSLVEQLADSDDHAANQDTAEPDAVNLDALHLDRAQQDAADRDAADQGAATHVDVFDILSPELAKDSAEFAAIEPAASRLLDKINRTGDYCSNNFASSEPISKFVFFGETDDCTAFMEYAALQVPNPVEKMSVFDDPSVSLAIQVPAGAKERAGIIPALGLSLSNNSHTPNFFYTYLEKAIRSKYRKMNMAIAAAAVLCLVIVTGVWGWFNTRENALLAETAKLEQQLAQYTPTVTRQALTQKITAARKKAEEINRYAGDYLPLAVINEICTLTPGHIELISIDSVFPDDTPAETNDADKAAKARKDAKSRKPDAKSIIIKGVVNAAETDLDSTLTSYVIHLGDSPLFGDIKLQEKETVEKAPAPFLTFTADMEIL